MVFCAGLKIIRKVKFLLWPTLFTADRRAKANDVGQKVLFSLSSGTTMWCFREGKRWVGGRSYTNDRYKVTAIHGIEYCIVFSFTSILYIHTDTTEKLVLRLNIIHVLYTCLPAAEAKGLALTLCERYF